MQPNKDRRQNPKRVGLTTKQLIKRTKRITTVEDILARDNVNDILVHLDKVKPNISDLIVVYYDKEGNGWDCQITEDTLISTATWLLESAKLALLNENEDE